MTEEKYRPVIEQALQKMGEYGQCQRLPWGEAAQEFGVTTVSRVGLIEQDRPDGRRLQILTLDVEDAGGNVRLQVHERVILPTGVDVIRSLTKAASWDGDQVITSGTERLELEFVKIEVRDLAIHLLVATEELRHCIGRRLEEGKAWVWPSLRIGFRPPRC